jgi:predicted  nucleic acid-binding Zn-ribbon protein
MKNEIENLSVLAAQSNDRSGMQKESIQESMAAVAELRPEVEKLEGQIVALFDEVEGAKFRTPSLKAELGPIRKEMEGFGPEIAAADAEIVALGLEKDEIGEQMSAIKGEVQGLQAVIVANEERIRQAKANVAAAERKVQNAEADRKMIVEEIKGRKARIEEKKELAVRRRARAEGRQEAVEKVAKQVDDMYANVKIVREELREVNERLARDKKELSQICADRKAIAKQRLGNYHEVARMRKLVPDIQAKMRDVDLAKVMTHVAVEREYRESRELCAQEVQERTQTVAEKQNNDVRVRDVREAKKGGHSEREIAYDIGCSVAIDSQNVEMTKMFYRQYFDEAIDLHEQADEATIKLFRLDNDIKLQSVRTSVMHADRDLVARKVEKQNKKNMDVAEETRLLKMLVHSMKLDIRNQDRELVGQRLKTCEILAAAEQIEPIIHRFERKIAALNEKMDKMVDHIRFYYHTNEEKVSDLKALLQDRKNELEHLNRLERHNGRRDEECLLLLAKIRIMQGECRLRGEKFQEKSIEIEKLEAELAKVLDRQSHLMLSRRRAEALRAEWSRLDKKWMETAAEALFLEQEEELPMRVDRFALLSATNPGLYNLIQLRHQLVNKLWVRVLVFERLQNQASALRSNLAESARLISLKSAKHTADISEMATLLNKRTRELAALETSTAAEAMIAEREKVEAVRNILRQRRAETTQNYEIISDLRSSIQPPPGRPNTRSPGRVKLGGGFPAGETVVMKNVPMLDLQRSGSDRARKGKSVSITVPQSGRPHRPKTLGVADRNRIHAFLSARLPEENL